MIDLFRKMSITQGLKLTTQNQHEFEVAARPHMQPGMRKLQKEYFSALVAEVTEEEVDILNVLNLPNIETVRKSVLQDDAEPGSGTFTMTSKKGRELDRIFYEWAEELVGTKAMKAVEPMEAIYPFYELQAFSLGLKDTMADAKKALPDYVDPEKMFARRVNPVVENVYLKSVIRDGTKRIKEKLSPKAIREIKIALRRMAKEGLSPIEVARWIHNEVGEGKSWYWLRLARSESSLAYNGAFDATMNEYKIPYEEWDAASNACETCGFLDGQQWRRGEGPRPTVDSHPSCACTMRTIWVTEKPIQNRWTRRSPYTDPWSQEEIQRRTERLVI